MTHATHSSLGKSTPYQEHYDPSLLFPIARLQNRQEMGISDQLPFMGADIWNAYELSWLNLRGKPQITLAQFVIPADSPYMIESKSFKLYLNSFNQTKLASIDALAECLNQDLSASCGAPVHIKFIAPHLFSQEKIADLPGYCIDNLDIDIDTYRPNPSLLCCGAGQTPIEEILTSHLLKSNCLVTGQPDWASVNIHYVGKPIHRESLLRYLIAFRQHNEFSEPCVERIFMDITRQCTPSKLAVYARYTRRGGLDINPFRTNFSGFSPENVRTARQ